MSSAKLNNITLKVPGDRGPKRVLVENLTFSAKAGQIVAIMGPNGSGKTTILRLLLKQIGVESGACHLDYGLGGPAYVPQNFRKALFPWLTVDQHIQIYQGGDNDFSKAYLKGTLEALDLELPTGARIGRFSGGEQQLLLLSLVLSRSSTFLCLDEPLAAVDLHRKTRVRALLSERVKKLDSAIVLVTHDFHDAAELASAAVVLRGDQYGGVTMIESSDTSSFKKKLHEALGN